MKKYANFLIMGVILFLGLGSQSAEAGLLKIGQWYESIAVIDNLRDIVDINDNVEPANSALVVGDHTTPSQRQAAGRSNPSEIAANASFDDRGYSFQNFGGTYGAATHRIGARSTGAHVGENVTMEFFLPPALLEFRDNLETGPTIPEPLVARITASILFSRRGSVDFDDREIFKWEAVLIGDYDSYSITSNVVSDTLIENPSPLEHTNVDIVSGFERTYTWETEAFTGHLFLGKFLRNDLFSIDYEIKASVNGVGAGNWAAAAINDPFFFESDPVTAPPGGGELMLFSSTPVPVPSTIFLLGLGLLGLAGVSRRKE